MASVGHIDGAPAQQTGLTWPFWGPWSKWRQSPLLTQLRQGSLFVWCRGPEGCGQESCPGPRPSTHSDPWSQVIWRQIKRVGHVGGLFSSQWRPYPLLELNERESVKSSLIPSEINSVHFDVTSQGHILVCSKGVAFGEWLWTSGQAAQWWRVRCCHFRSSSVDRVIWILQWQYDQYNRPQLPTFARGWGVRHGGGDCILVLWPSDQMRRSNVVLPGVLPFTLRSAITLLWYGVSHSFFSEIDLLDV